MALLKFQVVVLGGDGDQLRPRIRTNGLRHHVVRNVSCCRSHEPSVLARYLWPGQRAGAHSLPVAVPVTGRQDVYSGE